LVVEDDQSARALLRRSLERIGLEVYEAGDGPSGLKALFDHRPNLVLLDVGLPGLDGFRTLERVRELTDVPVMMVSGHASEFEKVRALKAGADDYVTKPYGVAELTARVEALLRRAPGTAEPVASYADDLVEIDFRAANARAGGKDLHLTPLEFRLLSTFVRHPGEVLSARELLQIVWGETGMPRERVKIYVGYLRNKFREAGVEAPIETLRGFGYRYRGAGGRDAA
jgi:DNA-binding response OmpR family regulator